MPTTENNKYVKKRLFFKKNTLEYTNPTVAFLHSFKWAGDQQIHRIATNHGSSCLNIFHLANLFTIPASWSNGNAFVSGTRGLSFKSRAGQIEHKLLPTACHGLRHFFERSCVAQCPGTMTRILSPSTRYTLLRNTTIIMKNLIWFVCGYLLPWTLYSSILCWLWSR